MFLDNNGVPVPFFVTDVINLYINKRIGETVDKEGMPLTSGTIVEFIFDNSSTNIKNNWIPLRTRHDKTQTMLLMKKKYGNNVEIGRSIWNTMVKQFKLEDIQILASNNM